MASSNKKSKNPIKPNKTPKNPVGWAFFKKPGFFWTRLCVPTLHKEITWNGMRGCPLTSDVSEIVKLMDGMRWKQLSTSQSLSWSPTLSSVVTIASPAGWSSTSSLFGINFLIHFLGVILFMTYLSLYKRQLIVFIQSNHHHSSVFHRRHPSDRLHRIFNSFLCDFWACHFLVTLSHSPSLSERRRYCVARRPSVTLLRCVCIRRLSLGGKGNVLYPMLSSLLNLCLV